MTGLRRAFGTLAAAALLVTPAMAYYHYVHFLSGPPYTPTYEKFDLSALLNKTVPVHVSDSAPQTSGADSFASVLSQVQQAAAVWDSVSTSDLRVAFAGLSAQNRSAKTPGIDVEFTAELAPGVLAEAAPTAATTPVTAADGTVFFPIVNSLVWLSKNADLPPGPSYAETFFTTAVHELGHALGLQHTFTASAMSQATIRSTTRTSPLGADDMAAISVLYGKAGWQAGFASISGKVTSGGQGVALASVVALPIVGAPVSTLTNPDGTYRIDGLPPNQYVLVVHPLPPDADVTDPEDASGHAMRASFGDPCVSGAPCAFETLFFPSASNPDSGTRDRADLAPLTLKAGALAQNRNVSVEPRSAVPVYDLVTYSYFDAARQTYSDVGNPVTPAFISSTQTATQGLGTLVFTSAAESTPLPASAALLGGFYPGAVYACCTPAAVAMQFQLPFFEPRGPRHLVLNFGNDMYVLPNGVFFVRKNPPAIASVKPNADGSATVAGSNMGPDTKIYFDGLPASIQTPFSGNDASGSITVIPPPGFSGQQASVVAYTPEGQSSMTFDSVALAYGTALPIPPPTYAYPAVQPQVKIEPASLPAGAFAQVDITASDMNFLTGGVTVGFGTADAIVRQLWVLSPTHVVADVMVAPDAALGTSEVSAISGFRSVSQADGFQLLPAASGPTIQTVSNGTAGQATLYPGGLVSVTGANLAGGSGATTVAMNGTPLPIVSASATQVVFQVPLGFAPGVATLHLSAGSASALPVAIEIDPAPPVITSVMSYPGQPIGSGTPATVGDVLKIEVTGLDPAAISNPSRVVVTAGTTPMPVIGIIQEANGASGILILLTQPPYGEEIPITAWVDGSSGAPFSIPIVPRTATQ